MASQVMESPTHSAAGPTVSGIQRFSSQSQGQMEAAPASVNAALASPSTRLEPALQADMERGFGHDFSGVRVHTGAAAATSAQDVNAKAYTAGSNIVFGRGAFASASYEGRRLIAHELAHVVQQTGPAAAVIQRTPDGGEKEKTDAKPAAKFVGCSDEQQTTINEAIQQAERLASRAVSALERDYPLGYESSALRANFASLSRDQSSTVTSRYKDIAQNAKSKTYKCAKAGKKVREGGKVVDLCGEAWCPGTEITVFPDFGKQQCPAGPVLLHEAAHNAGACSDIDKGRRYPPADPENDAYCYEYFATDVAAGYKEPPVLKKRDTSVPH